MNPDASLQEMARQARCLRGVQRTGGGAPKTSTRDRCSVDRARTFSPGQKVVWVPSRLTLAHRKLRATGAKSDRHSESEPSSGR